MNKCNCGNKGCEIRTARGLVPFCQMNTKTVKPETFGSYQLAAAARKDGQKVVSVGNRLNGTPRCFILVEAAVSRPPRSVSDYMARIGKKGGEAKGARKKRSIAHYKAAAAKRWAKEKKP